MPDTLKPTVGRIPLPRRPPGETRRNQGTDQPRGSGPILPKRSDRSVLSSQLRGRCPVTNAGLRGGAKPRSGQGNLLLGEVRSGRLSARRCQESDQLSRAGRVARRDPAGGMVRAPHPRRHTNRHAWTHVEHHRSGLHVSPVLAGLSLLRVLYPADVVLEERIPRRLPTLAARRLKEVMVSRAVVSPNRSAARRSGRGGGLSAKSSSVLARFWGSPARKSRTHGSAVSRRERS